jgi:hypothetical protein
MAAQRLPGVVGRPFALAINRVSGSRQVLLIASTRPDSSPRSKTARAGPVGSDRIGCRAGYPQAGWIARVTGSIRLWPRATVIRWLPWRRWVARAGWPLTSTLGVGVLAEHTVVNGQQIPGHGRQLKAFQDLRYGQAGRAATWSGPRPSRSPKPLAGIVPRRPRQLARLSAIAAAMPGGSAAAWSARGKECGGGHGSAVGLMVRSRAPGRLQQRSHDSEVRSAPNDYKQHLLANCTALAPASCLRNQLEPRGFRSPLFSDDHSSHTG